MVVSSCEASGGSDDASEALSRSVGLCGAWADVWATEPRDDQNRPFCPCLLCRLHCTPCLRQTRRSRIRHTGHRRQGGVGRTGRAPCRFLSGRKRKETLWQFCQAQLQACAFPLASSVTATCSFLFSCPCLFLFGHQAYDFLAESRQCGAFWPFHASTCNHCPSGTRLSGSHSRALLSQHRSCCVVRQQS